MKEYTLKEALYKAEAYCSTAEHCLSDVRQKLYQWGITSERAEEILSALVKERFIDEQRYSCAFVREKYRFNKWGRIKIVQELRLKSISSPDITTALNEIDEDEYMDILQHLLHAKQKTIKAHNDYERNGKLFRYALGRGFEAKEIMYCLKKLGCDDVDIE